MIRKIKTPARPSSAHLTHWRSDGSTCTVDVTFDKDAPIALSSTTGAIDDALLTLAARFCTSAITLDNLATEGKKP